MEEMFCFQCEQTAGGHGCTGKAGVCGKTAEVAQAQDKLTGALIGLSAVLPEIGSPQYVAVIREGLFKTVTNVSFSLRDINQMIDKVQNLGQKLASVKGQYAIYDLEKIWHAEKEDIRSLKSLLLFGLRGMAAYAYHASALGYEDERIDKFFVRALQALGTDVDGDVLLQLNMELGKTNLICMELLDRANTSTYGNPEPTEVTMQIEKGPFIIVTGHDLKDLELLLQQTEGRGINIYTHGEMLPCHAYPGLKKYTHLKGHFGTAWHNQRKEFAKVPAPILFTTNCLMPPLPSYADNIFTTDVVSYPNAIHIGGDKDFTPVIEKALSLGGYAEDTVICGINGGKKVTTGFGHVAVLSQANKIVEAVKKNEISHFFLVGGCDGMHNSRTYYTEFVKKTPQDSIILTLACGKFRFNDLDLGTVAGLPRLLDMGQCNDAYSAIKVATALAEAFSCSVNELPLTIVLSWYEQKAVCILLTLLSLGIKNFYLGPTLPAFVSPAILQYLVDNFGIKTLGTPEGDLQNILGASK